MEYTVLLEKVLEAQPLVKDLTDSKAECEIITLLLSELKEGILENHFRHKGKYTVSVEIFELSIEHNGVYVYTNHKCGAIQIRFLKLKRGENVNIENIIDIMDLLGLKCKKGLQSRDCSRKLNIYYEFPTEKENL